MPKGLVNLGNTCYFNSIMQVLLNAPLFGVLLEQRGYRSENKYVIDDPITKNTIELELPECDFSVRAIISLFKAYQNHQLSKSISPDQVISCIRTKTGRFKYLVQEDSHELLRALLEIIRNDEINRQKAAINAAKIESGANCFTIIDMIFGGYFLSSVQCQKCKFRSEHFEPFFDLSLAIADPIKNLKGSLENFFSNAILDGDNKFICQRCSKVNLKKSYEAGVKSTKIAVPPNILTLHLKRFEASNGYSERQRKSNGSKGNRNKKNKKKGGHYNDDEYSSLCPSLGASFRKVDKQIEFPEFLQVSPYTDNICYNLTKINGWPHLDQGSPIWYSLFAVVCHSGQLKGGHYTAYVKQEEQKSDSFSSKEFSEFIQTKPYLPDLTEVKNIRGIIRNKDLSHCHLQDIYDDDDDTRTDNSDRDYYEKPEPIPGSWFHISDTSVRRSTISEVLNSQAYLLFYRRVFDPDIDTPWNLQ